MADNSIDVMTKLAEHIVITETWPHQQTHHCIQTFAGMITMITSNRYHKQRKASMNINTGKHCNCARLIITKIRLWSKESICYSAERTYSIDAVGHICFYSSVMHSVYFSALTLLAGRQEGHSTCKNWVVGSWHGCLRGADLHVAQLMTLPLTVSCFSTFLVPAHLGTVVMEKGPLNVCSLMHFVTDHALLMVFRSWQIVLIQFYSRPFSSQSAAMLHFAALN